METGVFGFLLIGAGRGGASLLAGLLDSHPLLEVGFELYAIERLMGRGMPAGRPAARCIDDRTKTFRTVCEQTAAAFPHTFWGNKITTEQLYGLEDHNRLNPQRPVPVFDYFFNTAMAGIRTVFILRDDRACVKSKVSRTGQSWELACDRWLYSVDVYEYLAARPDAALTLKFEQLLTEPEPTLRTVCAFLGVPYDPRMLDGTDSGKMIPEYRHGKLDAAKAVAPQIDGPWLEKIRPGLDRCGYR